MGESKMRFKKFEGLRELQLTDEIVRLVVIAVTVVCIVVFMLLAVLAGLGVVGFGGPVDFVVFAILSGTGIYGVYGYLRARRIARIDAIFPDFVRDLAESRRAGMTFTRAILFASKGSYGILTPEIKKISQQVSWGSSVEDALTAFSKRVRTKSICRTIQLIIEASKSGGNVADVLEIAARDAREIKMLEAERRANMASYVVVIYVGMFVFLAIVLILCTSFIPAMVGGEGSAGMSGIMGGGSVAGEKDVANVFYLACLVQAFGSALVAGVFENGQFSSSVKHVFIMVFTSWLSFKMLMGV
jgi:archaeal flagellar protein FlaJ